ncbi:MAG: hypothetical protein V4754_16580 [Pseudomonadota bacterium]
MSGLRIGAFHLPSKDVAYLRALVRLFSYTAKLEWSFVEAAPYAVLVARVDDWARHGPDADFQGLVLRLGLDQDESDVHIIDYPIAPDQLGDWLKINGVALALALSGERLDTVGAAAHPGAAP